MDKILIVDSLKRELMKLEWWNEVQDDVKAKLEWVAINITEIGVYFANTFLTFFRWEYQRRKLENSNADNPLSGYLTAILGMRIPEEAFQCGKTPVRAVLNLYDYVDPNDADVASCLFLCHKIEALQKLGFLVLDLPKWETNPAEIFKSIPKKNPSKSKKITEENITWDEKKI